MVTMLLAMDRLNRIMTDNRPCRFCAIAVTLATRTCVRLRARWVGGLSSATLKSPSAALSLSHMRGGAEEISTAQALPFLRQRRENFPFDRLLSRMHNSQSQE